MINSNFQGYSKSLVERIDLGSIEGPRGFDYLQWLQFFKADTLDAFIQLQKTYPRIASFPWPMNSVIIYDPELINDLLVKNYRDFQKGDQVLEVSAVIGRGIAVNNNFKSWSRKRAIIAKDFSRPNIVTFENVIRRITQQKFSSFSSIEEVEIFDFFKDITFEISCETLLGKRLSSEESSRFKEALEVCSEISFKRVFQLLPLPYWVATKDNLDFQHHYKILESIIIEIIESSNSSNSSGVLRSLLGSEHHLSQEEIRDELLTLLIAAHETTAYTLGWAICLMTKEGGFERENYEEIIYETMRLYPALPLFSRKAVQDTELGNIKIPKNTNIVVPAHVLHRMNEFWESPESFMPSRFSDITISSLSHYLPFGKGARKCLGEFLSMNIMKVILEEFFKTFEIDTQISRLPKAKISVALSPSEDIYLKLKRK
ncbi:putative cytochrome P450 family protein [Halobacteriovorax marinus SJ]|uniref:Cytochrome P450 family protein n=1 Tax=Halobacteriovorax marinus (strain ATCC BAA-682 / DSM 15412 / SJ) TaxID=862908 RepID=E1WX36_HALMS|nr:cytochrome P450 [Halobacteriovorax marinus]CBW25737.1 putative cytochrome P450 family protein [Halobacteriovorax marinus SJ]